MGKIRKSFIASVVLAVSLATSGCSTQEAEVVKPVEDLGLSAEAACKELTSRMDTFNDLLELVLQDPSNANTSVSVGQTIANEGREILQLEVEDSEIRNHFQDIGNSQIDFGEHLQTAPEPYTAEWEISSELLDDASNAQKASMPFCVAALK